MENKKDIVKSQKKERNSNNSITSEESPFLSPASSPNLESNKEKINMDKLNNYNLQDNISTDENKKEKDIEISLDSLILNLKIISKLKPGCKLSIKDNNDQINDVYIDTSYLQYLYRIFSDNSRDQTTKFLEFLDKQITKKIEQLVKLENFSDSNMFLNSKENILLNLSHNLNLSLVGLNNLINTYINDEYIISKIEMVINNFELKIRKISNILKVN